MAEPAAAAAAAPAAAEAPPQDEESLELLRDVSALVEQAKGEQKAGVSFEDAMLSLLKPVERYAIRWLDEVEPIIDMAHQARVGASIQEVCVFIWGGVGFFHARARFRSVTCN